MKTMAQLGFCLKMLKVSVKFLDNLVHKPNTTLAIMEHIQLVVYEPDRNKIRCQAYEPSPLVVNLAKSPYDIHVQSMGPFERVHGGCTPSKNGKNVVHNKIVGQAGNVRDILILQGVPNEYVFTVGVIDPNPWIGII